MIEKLIEKYKNKVFDLQASATKWQEKGYDTMVVYCNERIVEYEEMLQDLEELKKIVREELYNSDCTVAEYNGACERLGVDTDE